MKRPILGDVLREARDAEELTVRELAARMGVSPATISAAERGSDVGLATLQRALAALPALTASRLLGRPEAPGFDLHAAWRFQRRAMGLVARSVTVDAVLEPGGALVVTTQVAGMRLLRDAGPEDVARLASTTWLRSAPPKDVVARLLAGARVTVDERHGEHRAKLARADGPRPVLSYSHRERRVAGVPLPWGTDAAFAPAFHESPGFALSLQAPVERLVLVLRASHGALPSGAGPAAWPAGILGSADEIDLSPSVAPLPLVEREPGRLRVEIEHPLPGFAYGLLWGEGRPRSATSPAIAPTIAPATPRGAPGESIRRARELADVSRRELARRVGVSPSGIVEVERGDRELRCSTARALIEALPALRPAHLLRDAAADLPFDAGAAWSTWRELMGFETERLVMEHDLRKPGRVTTSARVEGSRTLPGRSRRLRIVTRAGREETLRSESWSEPIEIRGSGATDEVTLRFVREGRHLVGLVQVVPKDVAEAGLSTSSRGTVPAASVPVKFGESILAPLRAMTVSLRLPDALRGSRWEARAWPACEPDVPPSRDAWPRLGRRPVATVRGDRVELTIDHPATGFFHALVLQGT